MNLTSSKLHIIDDEEKRLGFIGALLSDLDGNIFGVASRLSITPSEKYYIVSDEENSEKIEFEVPNSLIDFVMDGTQVLQSHLQLLTLIDLSNSKISTHKEHFLNLEVQLNETDVMLIDSEYECEVVDSKAIARFNIDNEDIVVNQMVEVSVPIEFIDKVFSGHVMTSREGFLGIVIGQSGNNLYLSPISFLLDNSDFYIARPEDIQRHNLAKPKYDPAEIISDIQRWREGRGRESLMQSNECFARVDPDNTETVAMCFIQEASKIPYYKDMNQETLLNTFKFMLDDTK